MRWSSLFGVCAVLGSLLAVSASAHPPIHSGHSRFVPVIGNWDGSADGFAASFELAYEPSYRFDGPLVVPYGFANLVLLNPGFDPDTCSDKGEPVSQEIIGENDFTPVYKGGSFHLSSERLRGGLVGARSAQLSTVISLPGCRPVRLTWRLRPVHRRVVRDGVWELRFSDGEHEKFTVVAGGRAVPEIGFPSGYPCESGGVGLFLQANGRGTARADSTVVTLQFARNRATGEMAATAGGGLSCHLTMTAELLKRKA